MDGTPFGDAANSIETMILYLSLVSVRLFAAFSITPFSGDTFMPGMVKNALVMVIGTYVAFGMPVGAFADISALSLAGLVLKEAFIGLTIGFCASTVFWVAQSVGALIDTQAGYNSVQLTNPLSGESSTPVSDLLLQVVIAVFFSLGGMLVFIGALFESFKAWPLMSPLPSIKGSAEVFLLGQVDGLMVSVVKFSAPALLILLLIDLGFGLVTRAADKLEPTSMSQAVKGAVTMLLLAFMAGVFVVQVRSALLPTDLMLKMQSLMSTR